MDWVFSWFLCEQSKALGATKALVKKSFKVVPIIGWTAFFSENAFLERVKDKYFLSSKLYLMSYPYNIIFKIELGKGQVNH